MSYDPSFGDTARFHGMASSKIDCGDEDAASVCSTEIPWTPFSGATEPALECVDELTTDIFFLNEDEYADGLPRAKADVYWDRRGPIDLCDNETTFGNGTSARLTLALWCTFVALWVAALVFTWHLILFAGMMSSSRGVRMLSMCFALWGLFVGAFLATPLLHTSPSRS
eukprot:TRINITY_DN3983_c0_g3_i1.p1 TRINITY_DN3983_c0_g3~~TRINITY_DN3983_c0_g3_i1.p1  ORF type:complete len:198 (+),score=19.05 TRINITY_DN3983_c0_g3_i1:88-594(+)